MNEVEGKDINYVGNPTSLFIDKNGSLIEARTGAMNIDTMREYVELILTQVAVGTSNTVYKSFLDIEQ